MRISIVATAAESVDAPQKDEVGVPPVAVPICKLEQ